MLLTTERRYLKQPIIHCNITEFYKTIDHHSYTFHQHNYSEEEKTAFKRPRCRRKRRKPLPDAVRFLHELYELILIMIY